MKVKSQPDTTLRIAIWERDKGICGICGDLVVFSSEMHIDRIDATIRGYEDMNNLRATHAACNLRKGGSESTYIEREVASRTTVLIPTSLYERLKVIADTEQRSTHRQILHILERFVSEDEKRGKEPAS